MTHEAKAIEAARECSHAIWKQISGTQRIAPQEVILKRLSLPQLFAIVEAGQAVVDGNAITRDMLLHELDLAIRAYLTAQKENRGKI